jgi:hypothetical protein
VLTDRNDNLVYEVAIERATYQASMEDKVIIVCSFAYQLRGQTASIVTPMPDSDVSGFFASFLFHSPACGALTEP